MSPLTILQKAKDLIDTPNRWTKNQLARGKNNVPCLVDGNKVLSLCLDGAVFRVCKTPYFMVPSGTGYKAREALNTAIVEKYSDRLEDPNGYGLFVTEFNDHKDTDHRDVMDVFERAIEMQEKKERDNI